MDIDDVCVDGECDRLGKCGRWSNPACPCLDERKTDCSKTATNNQQCPHSCYGEHSSLPRSAPLHSSERESRPKLREIAVQTSVDSFEYHTASTNVHYPASTGVVEQQFRENRSDLCKYEKYARGHEDWLHAPVSSTEEEAKENRRYHSDITDSNSFATTYPYLSRTIRRPKTLCGRLKTCSHQECTYCSVIHCQHQFPSALSPSRNSTFNAGTYHPVVPIHCTCEEYAEYEQLQELCDQRSKCGDKFFVIDSICSDNECTCENVCSPKDDGCLLANSESDIDCYHSEVPYENHTTTLIDGSLVKDKSCLYRKGYVHFNDEHIKDKYIDSDQSRPLLTPSATKISDSNAGSSNANDEVNDNIEGICSRGPHRPLGQDGDDLKWYNTVCQCKCKAAPSRLEQRPCIRIIPNHKNSSGLPSALKIITFVLIGSAFFITSAAIKQAYF